MTRQIIMLGTGSAFVTRCYNTCFVIEDNGTRLLVDAGGGNGILSQMERAGIAAGTLHDMFVTHCHTDHILGAVWVVRKVVQLAKNGTNTAPFTIHGHHKAIETVKALCRLTLAPKDLDIAARQVIMHEVGHGEAWSIGTIGMETFDIHSTKEMQYGFRATLGDGCRVTCLGDEPFNTANRPYAEGSDWLMHEAFCLYADRDRFKPYEKHHSTALDAGRDASLLGVGNLLLYHTEDRTLETRKAAYSREAAQTFDGNIVVPDDLEAVDLHKH